VRGRQPVHRNSPVGCCEGDPGSALNSNLHFHALVTDGVFTCPSPFTRAYFRPAEPLDDEHVEEVSPGPRADQRRGSKAAGGSLGRGSPKGAPWRDRG